MNLYLLFYDYDKLFGDIKDRVEVLLIYLEKRSYKN
jgi:hypothetical protein